MPDINLIERYFFWLVLYSIIGWVYECIVESIRQKKIVNRGFLNGPYCPIYGFGSLLDVVVLGWIENPFVLFVTSAVLTCTLEYITSVVMEKLFNARWWDYYDFKFNINGRVCLLGAFAFGTLSLILVKFIHPFMVGFTNLFWPPLFHIVTVGLFVIVTFDVVITVSGFLGFDNKLKELSVTLDQIKSNIDTRVNSSSAVERISTAYTRFSKSLNHQQMRLLKSFPRLQSIKYKSLTDEVKKFIFKDTSKKGK